MVSFQCENCGDVLTKKKLDQHRNRCRGATFSCIDCMVHFQGFEYRSHTSCMTEDQKYQGALYKDNKNKNNNNNYNNNYNNNTNNNSSAKKVRLNLPPEPVATPRNSSAQRSNNTFATPSVDRPSAAPNAAATSTPSAKRAKMASAVQRPLSHHAYVEDVPEELEGYLVADDGDNESDDGPIHAPTPPPAVEAPINVFDFLVASSTPNTSNMHLNGVDDGAVQLADDASIMHYPYDNDAFLETPAMAEKPLVEYGTGPVRAGMAYETPAPAPRERRKSDKDSKDSKDSKDAKDKKDKKRKRLYLDINDQVMTDAPPVLHSGLTGGLNRLSTKTDFPPSPESAETPASPLRKAKPSKHSKSTKSKEVANLFSMLTSSKPKTTKKRKHRSVSPTEKKRHRRHSSSKHSKSKKTEQKLLEYKSDKKEDGATDAAAEGQMIVYKPPADLFMSFVNKGPESERGCSVNKALRRFHRERESTGEGNGKRSDEKELFHNLRLRKNDRGEIVLFVL